ncbi:MAG: glycosyltransferase [Thermoplasmatales archaeon]
MGRVISIINASRASDGITRVILQTYNLLRHSQFEVGWIQIRDRYTMDDLPEVGEIVDGITFPPRTLSMGISRSRIMRRKLEGFDADIDLLSEPTLINLVNPDHKTVVRFHDFRPLSEYSDNYITHLTYKSIIPKLRKVKYAIFSTEYIKNEALKLGIVPKASVVAYDSPLISVHREHVEESLKRLQSGKINITCISTDRPYKNLIFYLRLVKLMTDKYPGKFQYTLVTDAKKDLLKEIKNCRDLIHIPKAPHIEDIYKTTDMIIIPSLYEGYGLPLVEAMYFGIPVMLFELPSFKEILGEYDGFQTSSNLNKWADFIIYALEPENYKRLSSIMLKRVDWLIRQDQEGKLRTFFESL